MTVNRITIEVLDRAAIRPPALPGLLTAQFNPTEYTLSKGAQFAEVGIPGLDSPLLQFVRGQSEKVSLELLFDTAEDGGPGAAVDVRTRTAPFHQLCKLQPATHAVPRVRVTWGEGGLSFVAVVENVDQKFTLFAPSGVPVRATVTLSFREYRSLQDQVAELESADHTKRRVVRRGDTLSRIAGDELGDARLWRIIADANLHVGSPTDPDIGAVLTIPPVDPLDVAMATPSSGREG